MLDPRYLDAYSRIYNELVTKKRQNASFIEIFDYLSNEFRSNSYLDKLEIFTTAILAYFQSEESFIKSNAHYIGCPAYESSRDAPPPYG